MTIKTSKTFFAGLGVYAVCITFAALPIFTPRLGLDSSLKLVAAAVIASLLVMILRYAQGDAQLDEHDAVFAQSVLGVIICGGIYTLVGGARPEIVTMSFMLWATLGLPHLSPGRVLTLFGLNLAIYLYAHSGKILVATGTLEQSNAIFMLMATVLMGALLYWRAFEYRHASNEKAILEDAHEQHLEKLKDAEARIHTITTQDIDTIALKYPYFKRALIQEKTRADRMNCTFSIGMIEIDHYAELVERLGELPAKQVLREFADRATLIIRRMDSLVAMDPDYHPLGRIGEGLFGFILPMTDMEGAMRCAERLHTNVDLDAFRTKLGTVRITLSIGLTEYSKGENVDELIALAGCALQGAEANYGNDIKGIKYPAGNPEPVKAARSAQDLQLLDYKDYARQVH